MADTRELYIKTKVEDMIVYGNICLKQFRNMNDTPLLRK